VDGIFNQWFTKRAYAKFNFILVISPDFYFITFLTVSNPLSWNYVRFQASL
jgi:hypothetical protein